MNLVLATQLYFLIFISKSDAIMLSLAHYVIQDLILLGVSKGSYSIVIVYNLVSLAFIHSSNGCLTVSLFQLLIILMVFFIDQYELVSDEKHVLQQEI